MPYCVLEYPKGEGPRYVVHAAALADISTEERREELVEKRKEYQKRQLIDATVNTLRRGDHIRILQPGEVIRILQDEKGMMAYVSVAPNEERAVVVGESTLSENNILALAHAVQSPDFSLSTHASNPNVFLYEVPRQGNEEYHPVPVIRLKSRRSRLTGILEGASRPTIEEAMLLYWEMAEVGALVWHTQRRGRNFLPPFLPRRKRPLPTNKTSQKDLVSST